MSVLADLSYKQLQAEAKKHGISAKQKAAALLSTLQALPEYASGNAASPSAAASTADADNEDAMDGADEPAPAAAKKRGRPTKNAKTAAAAQEDDASASAADAASVGSRKRASAVLTSAADDDAQSTRSASTAGTGAARKKSKLSHPAAAAAGKKSSLGPSPAEEDEEPAQPIVRVTKRGRKPKRQPSGAELAASAVDAPAAGSRRPSAATQQQTAAAASTPRAASAASPARPDAAAAAAPLNSTPLVASGRKRWTHAPVKIAGIEVAPPPTVVAAAAAAASRPSGRWQAPASQQRRSFDMGSGGSGRGPTSQASVLLQEQYREAHSRPSIIISPSRGSKHGSARSRAMAGLSQLSSPPHSGAGASTPRAAASLPSSAHHASASSQPRLLSPPAPLSSARVGGPQEVASRLRFSRFSPEKVAAAAASSTAKHADSPVKKLPHTLFRSEAYHAPGAAAAGAGVKSKPAVPAAGGAAAKHRATMGGARAGGPAGSPAAARSSLASTAGPGQLFSRDARTQRLGAPAAAGGAPRGSPAASQLGRKSFAATAGASSLASSLGGGGAAAAPARPQFDLAASLSQPLGWKLKTGSVRPAASAIGLAPSAAFVAPSAASQPANAPRASIKAHGPAQSTKPAQAAQQQRQRVLSRHAQLQKARQNLQ